MQGSEIKGASQRIKKSQFAGVGALVQLVGVAVLLGGLYLALHQEVSYTFSFEMFSMPIGALSILAFLGLLILGARMSVKTLCGNCRQPLVGREATACPHCGCELKP
jgi:Na+-translocating ferredoxin:NAD+ oxidoreductase RnfD subunit